MSTGMKTLLAIATLLLLLVISTGLFVIKENERGIILRLGKIETLADGQPHVRGPGLHFKWPFITQARIFDMRLQTLGIESSRIVTSEKKDLLVDYFVKWRINEADIPLFYTRTGGKTLQINTLLQQKLNDSLRAEFGKRTIKEVVTGERRDVMLLMTSQAKRSGQNLGVEVIDVRIKRIDLPAEVSNAVYARMRAERERVATEHRAEGKSAAEAIRAAADAKVTVLLAEAQSRSKEIRGRGEAQSAGIYAKAYQQDLKFYTFYRSMQAYQQIFQGQQDILVLKPDSQFFRYFNDLKASRTSP